MKYIVYRSRDNHNEPYQVEKMFDGEEFEVFEERVFEKDGTKAIIPNPHILITKDGHQVNIVHGESVECYGDVRKARIHASHLNQALDVMES